MRVKRTILKGTENMFKWYGHVLGMAVADGLMDLVTGRKTTTRKTRSKVGKEVERVMQQRNLTCGDA